MAPLSGGIQGPLADLRRKSCCSWLGWEADCGHTVFKPILLPDAMTVKPNVVGFLLMHLTFVEAASSHSSSTSSPSSIIPDYSISLSLGQKLELLGWKDVAMLSGREQELLVGLAEVLMSCSTDETIAKYLINWLPKQ
eukprot:1155817-Pelagomonas_calceolata.AAC.1